MAFPLAAILAIILLSLCAPILAPYDPLAQAGPELSAPSSAFPLGTDLIGRDVFSRVLHGGARTLAIAALAVIGSVLPGLLIGAAASWFGGLIDALLSALIDALLAIPALLIALVGVTLLGSGAAQVALAVGVAGLPGYARVARAAVRAVRVQPYIESARAVGARGGYILWWHVIPNATGPLLSFAVVTLAWALLNAAMLNFLGFGGDPALPEWGAMLADARQIFRVAPWVAVGPGAALSLTLLAVNALADALSRDINRAPLPG